VPQKVPYPRPVCVRRTKTARQDREPFSNSPRRAGSLGDRLANQGFESSSWAGIMWKIRQSQALYAWHLFSSGLTKALPLEDHSALSPIHDLPSRMASSYPAVPTPKFPLPVVACLKTAMSSASVIPLFAATVEWPKSLYSPIATPLSEKSSVSSNKNSLVIHSVHSSTFLHAFSGTS
jgi:hypothetical protein